MPEQAQARAKSGSATENKSGNANGASKPLGGDKKSAGVNRMAAMWSKAPPKKAAPASDKRPPPDVNAAQLDVKPSVAAAKPSAVGAKPGVARKRSATLVRSFPASSPLPSSPEPLIHLQYPFLWPL